mmetsp:Transcript_2475/g.5778  ORF Transcript_2475/g.5778 Transcript_2475/m.5778 type:complete len:137 (-) Transcript_2475:160-570(-)
MTFSSTTILALCATFASFASFANAATAPAAPAGTTYVGAGGCISSGGGGYLPYCGRESMPTVEACHTLCLTNPTGFRGFQFTTDYCSCYHDAGTLDASNGNPTGFDSCNDSLTGVGEISGFESYRDTPKFVVNTIE